MFSSWYLPNIKTGSLFTSLIAHFVLLYKHLGILTKLYGFEEYLIVKNNITLLT